MSCCFCQHWIEDANDKPRRAGHWLEDWSRETGECALHPQRKKTTAHYFCSQLRFKDAGLPISWRRTLERVCEELSSLRGELKYAKARKKTLNAKVRELRADSLARSLGEMADSV